MPYSILIVDDSPVLRHALRACLEENGGWVVCGEASDGREAIEKAQLLKPDLIILDLSMPGMNGLTAARELKRIQPDVPLLMFTTFMNTSVEAEGLAAGCAAVIAKSEIELLFTSIEQIIPKSWAQ